MNPMKVNLSTLSPDNFMVHQHFVGEHEVYLVQPVHIGATWTKENLIFRSSVWDKDGNPVSLSFKKFFNWDEKPEIFPAPESLANAQLMEKVDGSTLIFSRYKGHTVIRTRGTVDARAQENGYEIDFLCEKYAPFIRMLELADTLEYSYVFEWTSPTNRIVLNYGDEPDMVLTAVISHEDYSYISQSRLDMFAVNNSLRRPRTYSYDSVADMKASVEALRDQEGLCVYYGEEQHIRKVKSAHYLYLHRAKSEISSIEKVIDLYISEFMANGAYMPYEAFMAYLEKTFDYEIATMARGHVSRICDGMKEVREIMTALIKFAQDCQTMKVGSSTVTLNPKQARKSAAEKVLQAYGSTGRSSIIFKLLDGKPIVADDYKKILYQVLK